VKYAGWFIALLTLLLAGQVIADSGTAGPADKLTPMQALGRLGDRLTGSQANDEILPVDQAFQFDSDPPSATGVVLHWHVTEGYYLYRDKIKVELPDATGITIGALELPKGEVKQDEFFGRMEIYKHDFQVRVPLSGHATTPGPVELKVTYQGCATAGICYPPVIKQVSLDLAGLGGAASPVTPPATPAVNAPVPEQDRIAQTLASGRTWVTLLSFFGFGLLLAFTPCVFPMVPILSGLIVGQGKDITAARAFLLSLAYVLAMALTYTIAGVCAALFGANLQAAFQNPWVLGSFSALFVLLAMSLFGFYDLQVPTWLQGKLTDISNRQRGGTLLGAAIMGLLSALIVGPCVAAPLAAALIYIGKTGDAVLGGSALFMLSLGMGAPLLVLGASAGKLLPRAGAWMNTVKAVFGVLLLAVAIWMLERILPGAITMTLWAVLLIVSGVYMGALERLQPDATGWRKFWKGIGLVIVLYGALLLVGAGSGGSDVLQPLEGTRLAGAASTTAPARTLSFTRIKSVSDLQNALAAASASDKAVMLDFYADWCVSCKEMEKYTFADPTVQQMLSQRVLLQADVTANDAQDHALLQHLGLIGPPSILFFSPQGRECSTRRVMGYLKPEEFRRFAADTGC
jgi:thioredoxin:protein disulfide reductase